MDLYHKRMKLDLSESKISAKQRYFEITCQKSDMSKPVLALPVSVIYRILAYFSPITGFLSFQECC